MEVKSLTYSKHVDLHIQAIHVDKNNLKEEFYIYWKMAQVGVQVVIFNK